MSFEAFDTEKIDEYARRARQAWGETSAWGEFEEKHAGYTHEQEADMGAGLMQLFVPFGEMAASGATSCCAQAQQQAAKVQAYVTENYYTCTDEIFAQLGAAYGAGGEFTSNINAVAGEGSCRIRSGGNRAQVLGCRIRVTIRDFCLLTCPTGRAALRRRGRLCCSRKTAPGLRAD